MKKVFMDQAFTICNDKLTFELLIKVFLDVIKKNINFKLVCPFKKVSVQVNYFFLREFRKLNFYFKGLYEVYPFKQNYGVFLNLFPLHHSQRYEVTIRGVVGKKMEIALLCIGEFEIVEVD